MEIGAICDSNERITINVGGIKHETFRSTLRNFPDTRLAWIAQHRGGNYQAYDPVKNEYFFDRNPTVFCQILNYYRTGSLHSPSDTCGPLYEEELQFWGIDEKQMEPCCWARYTEHRDAQENLKVFDDPLFNRQEDDYCYSQDEDNTSRQNSIVSTDAQSRLQKLKNRIYLPYFKTKEWRKTKMKVWLLFDDHRSSVLAKMLTFVSLSFIVLSVISLCVHSVWKYSHQTNSQHDDSLYIISLSFDIICCIWFTIELLARFIFCPSRLKFVTKSVNWIDALSLISYYVWFVGSLVTSDHIPSDVVVELLSVARLLRLFRFFRLSTGLQILKHTLVASSTELLLLLLLLMIPVTIFATIVYFCERAVDNTRFKTIPESYWWAIVTMTTVGYGDMAPKTTIGKIFGSICATCSVFILALPVSIIGNNFSLFYSYAQARLKLPKKSHNAMVGAANVLVCKQPYSSETSESEQDNNMDEALSVIKGSNGSISNTISRNYRRERLSLYAGGLVRNGMKSSESKGFDSEEEKEDTESEAGRSTTKAKEKRNIKTRASNLTQTTLITSASDDDYSRSVTPTEENSLHQSTTLSLATAEERLQETATDNDDNHADSESPTQTIHNKNNNRIVHRSSTPFRCKRRSQKRGSKRIHPTVPKTIVTIATNDDEEQFGKNSRLPKIKLVSKPSTPFLQLTESLNTLNAEERRNYTNNNESETALNYNYLLPGNRDDYSPSSTPTETTNGIYSYDSTTIPPPKTKS